MNKIDLMHPLTLNTKILAATLCLGLAAVAGTTQAATTITIRPNAASSGTTNGDAFVTPGADGSLQANNFGGGGALAVSASTASNGAFGTFLRFDLASAKVAFDTAYGIDGWNISSVSLELTTANPSNPIFNLSATGQIAVQWIAADDWIEGSGTPGSPGTSGVTWNDVVGLTATAEAAGTINLVSVADGATAVHPLSPGSALIDDFATGGAASFYLSPADTAVSAVFNSRSFGTEARRPALVVTATPVPEPEWGGLLALSGWLAILRRRRHPVS